MRRDSLRTYPERAQAMVLYLLAVSLPWPIKTSIWALVLFLFISIITIRRAPRYSSSQWLFIGACFIYFLLHALYFFVTPEKAAAWFQIEKKLSFLFLPFLFLNKSFRVSQRGYLNTLRCYVLSIAIACVTCLSYAICSYFKLGTTQYFYYHDLCQIIRQHAVYFSMQIIIAIVASHEIFVRAKKQMVLFICTVTLLSFTLLLLSSKIMITCFFVLILFFLAKSFLSGFRRQGINAVVMLCLIMGFFAGFNRHITSRFADISLAKVDLLDEDKYNPQTYFDGFILRLVQIKFAKQILNEQQAWLMGVGPVRSQELLNDKYAEADMYTGEDHKSGYLGLNFHNQYVETIVRFGLIGLLLLVTLLTLMIRYAILNGNTFLLIVILLFSVFFFTESVLETERGLVTFLFFTCLMQKDDLPLKRFYDKKDI